MKKKTIQNSSEYYDITKDIRNYQSLSRKQVQFIELLVCGEQYELICIFNDCMKELISRVELFMEE